MEVEKMNECFLSFNGVDRDRHVCTLKNRHAGLHYCGAHKVKEAYKQVTRKMRFSSVKASLPKKRRVRA
jgi:hypothetical protein